MKKKDYYRLLAELVFKKDPPPPMSNARKEAKLKKLKPRKRLSVDEFVELVDELPDIREKLENALKKLEPKKKDDKKDHLTLGQKYMLVTIAAATLPVLYLAVLKSLF